MYSWNPDAAIMQLEKFGLKPTNARTKKSKSVGFSIDNQQHRHIAISCGTTETVTCYVNLFSITGQKFPDSEFEGVEAKQYYQRGHTGENAYPGIAGSIARNNPSLNPADHDVIRLHVNSSDSLQKLLAWYTSTQT